MNEKDGLPLEEEEEEKSVVFKIVNEMKHLMNEITHLKIELLMARLENNELENDIKELKTKLNAIYGKKGK